jgi:hypothetical protein
MARSSEQRTLHFALPFVPGDLEIKLHVGGQRHLLQRHTTATLSAARQVNRALRLLPEDQVTHFVPDLQLPADQAQLLLVSFPLPLRPIPPIQRLPILLLVKLHVPQNAVRTVLERKRCERHDLPVSAPGPARGRRAGRRHRPGTGRRCRGLYRFPRCRRRVRLSARRTVQHRRRLRLHSEEPHTAVEGHKRPGNPDPAAAQELSIWEGPQLGRGGAI